MSVLAFIPRKRTELQKAAGRGAEFLDEKRPGWADEIDTGNLAMISPCNCIIGQLTSHYTDGFEELVNDGHDPYGARARELGFILEPPSNTRWGRERDTDWEELTEAWAVEVLNRR